MERKLASVQKVVDVRAIYLKDGVTEASNIEQITVLGWRLVVKKGEFKVGDLAIYLETDSTLKPDFWWTINNASFMEAKGWRVKVMKLNNMRVLDDDGDLVPVVSQGLALPLDTITQSWDDIHDEDSFEVFTKSVNKILGADKLAEHLNARDVYHAYELLSMLNAKREFNKHGLSAEETGLRQKYLDEYFGEGADLTEFLEITKYEPPVKFNDGAQKGNFPAFIPKTDEIRIQSVPEVIREMQGKDIVITLKYDGTSLTAWYDGNELHVSSRNFERQNDGNVYWSAALKYKLDRVLAKHPNLAIQGEVVGEGIHGNLLGLKGIDLFIFNIYDIESGVYWNIYKIIEFCQEHNLRYAEVLCLYSDFDWDLTKLEEYAKGYYDNTKNPREGIVVRSATNEFSKWLLGRLSVKVINTDYLLAKGE